MRKSRLVWPLRFLFALVGLVATLTAAVPARPAQAQYLNWVTWKPSYSSLAAYWAPVICQDMDSSFYRGEYITRFNYDGNWSGYDNWNNISSYDLPANVYWWVIETDSHYFIGYGFFHPQDWDDGSADEHENDLEGILLTIRKWGTYGQFLTMNTVAHSDFYSYTDQDTPTWSPWYEVVAPSRWVTNGCETIDGDVDFVADQWGLHPVVYQEAKGHGVYGSRKHRRESWPYTVYNTTTHAPPIFEQNALTDWTWASWSGMPFPPGQPWSAISQWGDGILYHYEGVEDHPEHSSLHNWQVAGYSLVSIKQIWDHRSNPDTFIADFDTLILDSEGNDCGSGKFTGNDYGNGGANAPWRWDDGDDGPVYAGQMFTSPAWLVDRYFDNLGWLSYNYLGNSYRTAPSRWGDIVAF